MESSSILMVIFCTIKSEPYLKYSSRTRYRSNFLLVFQQLFVTSVTEQPIFPLCFDALLFSYTKFNAHILYFSTTVPLCYQFVHVYYDVLIFQNLKYYLMIGLNSFIPFLIFVRIFLSVVTYFFHIKSKSAYIQQMKTHLVSKQNCIICTR